MLNLGADLKGEGEGVGPPPLEFENDTHQRTIFQDFRHNLGVFLIRISKFSDSLFPSVIIST